MTAPVMFNRRLREQEIDLWLSLVENSTDAGYEEQGFANDYLQLPETIAFVSSINEEVIGATAIYKDKIRLGMVLSSVAILKDYRETSAYHIIKTSLPFMRTVAIRDVDALVVDNSPNTGIGFPASLGLDPWIGEILKKIGFVSIGKIWRYTLKREDSTTLDRKAKKWDEKPNLEGAKQLIWSQSNAAGLTTSTIWNALDFAMNRGVLRTFSIGDSTRIVLSNDKIGEISLIGLLMIDSEYSSNDAINMIAAELSKEQNLVIHFPLIGENQCNSVEMLSKQLRGSLKRESMTLMRKYL
jgi:hypothetical protein